MPAQRQLMQVGEEAQLHLPRRELLHPDPKERAQVAYKAWGDEGGASVELRGQMTLVQCQNMKSLRIPRGQGRDAWGRRTGRDQYWMGTAESLIPVLPVPPPWRNLRKT